MRTGRGTSTNELVTAAVECRQDVVCVVLGIGGTTDIADGKIDRYLMAVLDVLEEFLPGTIMLVGGCTTTGDITDAETMANWFRQKKPEYVDRLVILSAPVDTLSMIEACVSRLRTHQRMIVCCERARSSPVQYLINVYCEEGSVIGLELIDGWAIPRWLGHNFVHAGFLRVWYWIPFLDGIRKSLHPVWLAVRRFLSPFT